MIDQKFKNSTTKKRKGLKIFLIIFGSLVIVLLAAFFFWFKPLVEKPISQPLALPTLSLPDEKQAGSDPAEAVVTTSQPPPAPPSNLPDQPVFIPPTVAPDMKPVCGDDDGWIFLLVGIDYLGDGYLYGLADMIRLVRVDFINMTVNMLALPRDLLVEAPEGRFTVRDPYKLNQAYLFGTPGMGHYVGPGEGAHALAEVIQYNFGVTPTHYAVINFDTFVKFINAIGGIEVDLPYAIQDDATRDFPSGKQWLNGEDTLALARIREKYTDAFRIQNQTIIMRAVISKLMQPAMIVKIPDLINRFKNAFLTDLSIEDISTLGLCFLNNFDPNNLSSFQAPPDLITEGRAYIPSLSSDAFVYRWDQGLVDWIHQTLIQ